MKFKVKEVYKDKVEPTAILECGNSEEDITNIKDRVNSILEDILSGKSDSVGFFFSKE